MGCGASASRGAAEPEQQPNRDPDDYGLEYLELQPSGIEEFDTVFTNIEGVLNRLIELNNDINDKVAEVKAAYARATAGWELVPIVDVPDTDYILLDLRNKRQGCRPLDSEIRKLLQYNKAVKPLDTQLEEARQALHGTLAQSQVYISVRVNPSTGLLTSEPEIPEIANFNTAYQQLQKALGSSYELIANVKPAVSFGTPTIRAQLLKWENDESGVPSHQAPVTLLDIFSTEESEIIKEGEEGLLDKAQTLASRTKDMAFLQWQVLERHKVTMTVAIPDPQKRTEVKKALVDANICLFKLLSGSSSAVAKASLSQSVVEVIRPILMLVKHKHEGSGLPYSLKVGCMHATSIVMHLMQSFAAKSYPTCSAGWLIPF